MCHLQEQTGAVFINPARYIVEKSRAVILWLLSLYSIISQSEGSDKHLSSNPGKNNRATFFLLICNQFRQATIIRHSACGSEPCLVSITISTYYIFFPFSQLCPAVYIRDTQRSNMCGVRSSSQNFRLTLLNFRFQAQS